MKTDVAEVVLDQKAVEAVAEKATTGTVSVVVEKSKGGRQPGPGGAEGRHRQRERHRLQGRQREGDGCTSGSPEGQGGRMRLHR